jgi:high-affinity iron transporter
VVVSLGAGIFVFIKANELGEEGREIFENIMRLIAAGLIMNFIAWMSSQARNMSADIKSRLNKGNGAFGLFLLSFLSIFREGMELCIFTLTKISQNALNVVIGTILGIILAILLAYIIFRSSVKFNLKLIFKGLGLILIYLGAEMFSEGILGLAKMPEEPFEIILIILYALPAVYLFFKKDIQNIRR